MLANEPVFIIGVYKSGTSWLLRILDQHPAMRGVREIDLLKAGAGDPQNGNRLLPLKERLFGYFGGNSWGALPKDVHADDEVTAILYRYTGTGQIQAIFDLPAERAVDAILELTGLMSQPSRTPWTPNDKRPLLSLLDLPRTSVIALYRNIAEARSVYEAGDAFLESLTGTLPASHTLVLKGADQIARYGYLKGWRPDARKLAIVRDGRDAAISAMHFRRLMHKVRRAHVGSESDYWELLTGWASRVRMLLAVAEETRLAILRYEDLKVRFQEVVGALFRWLELPVSATDLVEMQRMTGFELLTGRQPGESAEHVMRMGMIGEWQKTLSPADADRAWEMVEHELTALGYTREGRYKSLHIQNSLLFDGISF